MNSNFGPTVRRGIVAGLVLYLTVAAFLAGLNLLAGRSPFYTVQLLGEPLLGARPVVPGPAWHWFAGLTFNTVHLMASLLLGMAAAFLIGAAEHARRSRWVFLLLFVVGSVVVLLGLQILTAEGSWILAWRSVLSAHLAGAVTTTAYLLWSRQDREVTEEASGPGE